MIFEALDSMPLLEEAKIIDAISVIQKSSFKLALVVGPTGQLLGTITDGDVRRSLLRNISISDSVAACMNQEPIYFRLSDVQSEDIILSLDVNFVPVLDEDSRPVGFFRNPNRKSLLREGRAALLMAGGKGTRLLPHTKDIPKPLVEVNGTPLIIRLIEQLAKSGILEIYVSVAHMAEKIITKLGDGSNWGVNLNFVRENAPLGTAGALSLLPKALNKNLLVINSDVYTSCDFLALVNFHESLGGGLTVGLRNYHHQIPFGVVEVLENKVRSISEKPYLNYQVAAGIYCISPGIYAALSRNQFLEMPVLIETLIRQQPEKVNGFPIHEQWEDVGRPEDLMRLRVQNEGIIET